MKPQMTKTTVVESSTRLKSANYEFAQNALQQ